MASYLGCCVDRRHRERGLAAGRPERELARGCNEQTCMKLPEGASCGSCVSRETCVQLFGAKPENTSCEFFPRKFRPIAAAKTQQRPPDPE